MTRKEAWIRFVEAIIPQALIGQPPSKAADGAARTADLLLTELDRRFPTAGEEYVECSSSYRLSVADDVVCDLCRKPVGVHRRFS